MFDLLSRSTPWGEHSGDVTTRLTIGDFSRMTYLSVKALRRYHDMGLLEPAFIDEYTGYRYYETSQVPVGQAIRRFRDLEMPLEQLREVVNTPDADSRNRLIRAHLEHMESTLQQTQQTVASLRALLERKPTPIAVAYRSVPTVTAIAITERVRREDIGAWWGAAFEELQRVIIADPRMRSGDDAALYTNQFFEDELGEVTAFIPVSGRPAVGGRLRVTEIPGVELAVAVHHGEISELDRTYGALGTFVAEREIGVQGPIRENYVAGADATGAPIHFTEVCWPVFRIKAEAAS
jgi:DNA-binding transcriptional MerR regulator/effector-binding domain-containing protein